MCGVAGIVAFGDRPGPSRAAIARMISSLAHRGPDERGLYRDAHAGLGHTRLSIIDLATGQQPLCNEDGTLWIVFNGEIFNYVELRAELSALGHRFKTKSDTEVIVHAWEAWGDDAFARMNGQWAVALWDSRRRRLVLARDRYGVRPPHYCEHAGGVLFASEVKALFAADRTVPRALDPLGLAETFTFWSVVPPRTAFLGIAEVEPGTVRSYDAQGAVREHVYWRPDYSESPSSIDDAVDQVRAALERATTLRMIRSDVPVGSYLSGGLDSSLVAALAAGQRSDRLHTFSLRFADAEYDETRFQRLMVERLGSEHHEIVVDKDAIARAFPEVIAHTERPILRTAPAPLFVLSALVRAHGIKVVLTGEGADELFAGYDLFKEGKVRRFWARQPGSTLRPRLIERLYPYLQRSPARQRAMAVHFFGRNLDGAGRPGFAHDTRWHTTAALQRLFSPALKDAIGAYDPTAQLIARLPPEFSSWSPLAQDQYLEIRTLLSGYLLPSQGDRMLMGHSVEGRFPFLDREVAALADRLPAAHKLHVLDEKHVLKRAARALIPAGIIARSKQPYRAPDALSFVGETRPEWVDAMISPAAVAAAGVFDPPAVAQLWKKCTSSTDAQLSNSDNMALVGVLSTQLLHHHFIATTPTVNPPPVIETIIDVTA